VRSAFVMQYSLDMTEVFHLSRCIVLCGMKETLLDWCDYRQWRSEGKMCLSAVIRFKDSACVDTTMISAGLGGGGVEE
jgi:hypothetical protein